MTIRFLHAADIHLDSPLVGLARYPGAPVDMLRSASRRAFENLVDLAIEECVDFVIIAGDLYDGSWKDFNTGIFFSAQMGRLSKKSISAFVLYGNHDAESEIAKGLVPPDNVRVFGSRKPETFMIEHLNVALHGQSFATRDTRTNLAASYPAPVPGWLNIGVLHTALGGHEPHQPYAPCTVDELRVKGYDYWALGHVHEHAVMSERPWVVFPGNLQGRHARELGPRGAVLVRAEDDAIVDVSRAIVDVLRWTQVLVELDDVTTLGELVDRVGKALEAAVEAADGRPVAARVVLLGRTALHGGLFADEAHIRAEIRAAAAALGEERIWIEKVLIETSPPHEKRTLGEAAADLHTLLSDASDDDEFIQSLSEDLDELWRKLPPEVKSIDSLVMNALRDRKMRNLVEGVVSGLLSHAEQITD